MNTATASFNTIVTQMTEMSQRKKVLHQDVKSEQFHTQALLFAEISQVHSNQG